MAMLERLSGDYNRGYTQAIMDMQEIFTYIQPDLRWQHKYLNGRLSLELLACCLENRAKIRDRWDGFIRFHGGHQEFEWHMNRDRS